MKSMRGGKNRREEGMQVAVEKQSKMVMQDEQVKERWM